MSLNLQNKKAVVAQVSETLSTAQTIVIAEYAGVTVESMTAIRAQARKANVFLHVVKNTLARIATKIISDFTKANDKVKIVAGMYNEQMLDVAGVKQLASIPSRDELLAMAMGVMQQVPAGFVRVVAALRDKKEQEAA